MQRAYYSGTIQDFIQAKKTEILGQLVKAHTHTLEDLQKNAWIEQISILKQALYGHSGFVFFEFSIPRMGKRADNIIIINDTIFVIEFKIGASSFERHAIEQVVDYCLDLKNFHEGSYTAQLIPILVATNAPTKQNILTDFSDQVSQPVLSNTINFKSIVDSILRQRSTGNTIDGIEWVHSIYKPTPTIIEAAQALYKGHNVVEISRADAGAQNLSCTTNSITGIIEYSKAQRQKSICFVTGVPGAGKTLVGLNITSLRTIIAEDEHAVFLSGNGPLVEVLREALARDKVIEAKALGQSLYKKQADSQVRLFIQNIHHFRDDALTTNIAPIEKVVVFDEAQRAWTSEQASKFMQRKKGVNHFNMSEPEFLIEVMDRHQDWCTVICLIGGGQEINTGEAGIEEWIRTFENRFRDWNIYYSTKIVQDRNYLKQTTTIAKLQQLRSTPQEALHLTTSIRSFRAEKLSDLVQSILSSDKKNAQVLCSSIKNNYPLTITRDFKKAKQWLKKMARGSERYGVLASSGACRLKPYGINVKSKVDAPIWFLNDRQDIRSSYFMEEIATEFDIQGLELDWTCIAWDIDFYYNNNQWHHRKFKGTSWQNIRTPANIEYLTNAYRVLLTRARQGMIIFIPYGDKYDTTRTPQYYDSTFNFLTDIGFEEMK